MIAFDESWKMSDPKQAIVFPPSVVDLIHLAINKVRSLILKGVIRYYNLKQSPYLRPAISEHSALCAVYPLAWNEAYLSFIQSLRSRKKNSDRFKQYARVLKSLVLPLSGLEGIYVPEVISSQMLVGKRLKGDLHAEIFENKPPFSSLSFESKLEAMKTLSKALVSLHERNLVHRDIKPANILVDESGRVYLCDWDQVKRVNDAGYLAIQTDQERRECVAFGTDYYRAPESWAFERLYVALPPDNRAEKLSLLNLLNFKQMDIWCLGVTFWEMVTGKSLYSELYLHLECPPSTLEEYQRHFAQFYRLACDESYFLVLLGDVLAEHSLRFKGQESFYALLKRMLCEAPAARPTAEEVFQTISALLSSLNLESAMASASNLCLESQTSLQPTLPSSVEPLRALPASCYSTESEYEVSYPVLPNFANLAVMPRGDTKPFDFLPAPLEREASHQSLLTLQNNLEKLTVPCSSPEEAQAIVSEIRKEWGRFSLANSAGLFKTAKTSQRISDVCRLAELELSTQKSA